MSVASRTRSKLKEESKHEEAMSLWKRLTEGLPDEIFLKLPGNSILSSRSVCKLFKHLLSEPIFINNHVNRSIQTKTNPKLLYSQSSPDKPPMIYSVPMDYASISLASTPSSSSSTPSSCKFRGAVQINYPFESKNPYNLDFLGSCNGLICFKISRIDKLDSERGHVETNYFSVLNPFTGEFKEFGTPRNSHHFTCGFGYDSKTGDYKLVAISDNDGCSNIDVYTVKSDSWNSIKGNVNYSFGITGKRSHGVFFDGALHWLGSKTTQKNSSEVVVCFDVSSETMLNMSLPENIIPPKGFCGHVYKNLGVWGDCICVAFAYDLVRLDVWVMQRYRVKDSWFKIYTTNRLPWSSHEIPFWKPLLCFDSGVILLDTGGQELILFDPTTERVSSVVVRDITAMYSNRESYFETIASLGSTTYLERQITDETVKNPKRHRFSTSI